jgi:hypothetical protein
MPLNLGGHLLKEGMGIMELTQEKLEEMVVGKSPNPSAIFFEQAVLNVQKSKDANTRIYDKKTYIKLSQVGVKDSVSYAAEKEDIRKYPEEYEYFLQNKQGVRKPSVEIIPNLDIAHLQELRDTGILTIPQLAEMDIVPPHLEYAHKAAKLLNKALQESKDEQEGNEKERTVKTEDVRQADRSQHTHDVRRYSIPRGDSNTVNRSNTGRYDSDRQVQRSENSVNDWSYEFKVR